MRLDERAERATETLRSVVNRDVQPAPMLTSLRRTRNRRRAAMVAVPLALALLGGAAVWSGTRPDRPAVVSPVPRVVHANGFLLGMGNPELTQAEGLHLPPISDSSSPTASWSPMWPRGPSTPFSARGAPRSRGLPTAPGSPR